MCTVKIFVFEIFEKRSFCGIILSKIGDTSFCNERVNPLRFSFFIAVLRQYDIIKGKVIFRTSH